jgi:hypothetical protein
MNVVPRLRRYLKLSAFCFAVLALVSLDFFAAFVHAQVTKGPSSLAAAAPTSETMYLIVLLASRLLLSALFLFAATSKFLGGFANSRKALGEKVILA